MKYNESKKLVNLPSLVYIITAFQIAYCYCRDILFRFVCTELKIVCEIETYRNTAYIGRVFRFRSNRLYRLRGPKHIL